MITRNNHIFFQNYFMTDEKKIKLAELQREKERIEDEIEQLNFTDPQEKMKGVLSTIVQRVKEISNPSNDESKEEATKRKDENT